MDLGWLSEQRHRPTVAHQRQDGRSPPRQYDEEVAGLEHGPATQRRNPRQDAQNPLEPAVRRAHNLTL